MSASVAEPQESRLAPIATAPLVTVAAAIAVLHGAGLAGYGYFRDELYYLASRAHLGFGYVDQPPLSILLLAGWTAVAGDSVIAIRLLALAGGLLAALLCALLARELGGRSFAQGLAALAIGAAPMLAGLTHIYSMNVLDLDFWLLSAWLLVRVLATGDPRPWPLLGLALGAGLENKISVLWLGAGIAVGLVATAARVHLRHRGPWLAGAIAVALFAPYVVWNAVHGFPTLEFIRNAERLKMVHTSPLALLGGLTLELSPALAPVWVGGLLWTLFAPAGRRFRILGIVWLVAFAIVAGNGTAKGYYLAPATSLLFAAGAVAWEGWLAVGAWRWLRPALLAAIVAFGLIGAPLAVPLLSEESFIAYARALGFMPQPSERQALGELPQHFADQHGWQEMADKVAAAYRRLTPEEQRQAVVFGQNYGEAGAIEVLGRRLGLPPAVSGHNSFWLWGPGGRSGSVVIILGGDPRDNAANCDRVEIIDTVHCAYCMPYERDLPVTICRGLHGGFDALWPRLKHFV